MLKPFDHRIDAAGLCGYMNRISFSTSWLYRNVLKVYLLTLLSRVVYNGQTGGEIFDSYYGNQSIKVDIYFFFKNHDTMLFMCIWV